MKRSTKTRILILFFLACLFFGSVHAYAASSSKKDKAPTKEQMHKWADSTLKAALKKKIGKYEPSVPLKGKIILSFHSVDKTKGCYVYGKYAIDSKNYEDPHPDDPFFQPVSYNGAPEYDVPASTWANTKKECDYLIVYGGFELSREKKYYRGGIDRVSVETRVYIIDMKKTHIVFEKDFGIDTPNPISTDHTTGYVNYRDSEAYIRYLLTGH